MKAIKAVRGTRDLLPPETELWNRIEATVRRVFARYCFGEIRTPIFEDTQLFARSVGEETDIVSKEMYTWEDGERFDKRSLVSAWREKNKDEGFIQGTSDPFIQLKKDRLIDEVFYRKQPGSGSLELVSFLPRVTRDAINTLKKAQEFARKQWPEGSPNLRMTPRIVTPLGGTQLHDAFEADDTQFEELPGEYYKSSQSLTLRPENTAGVVRAYIERNLGETGTLQKLYYIGPQFRRERPQKGRYRQFFQIGAEVIGPVSAGSDSPLRDAEILEMLTALLEELGILNWKLYLNSVGSAQNRPRYIQALQEALKEIAPKLCDDCQRRAVTNPLRVLDCKVPEDQPWIETLPKIAEYLDDESKSHFAQVCAALDACGVAYILNPRLVRGLDYYTRTTFEFVHGGLGAQNALLGGGRYDGLSEAIGGPKAPGIGFAMGADRLVLTLQEQQEQQGTVDTAILADVYIAPLGEAQQPDALVLARELRRAGLCVELGDGTFRMKKSFETGNKLARKIVLFGEDEAQSGIVTVKDLAKKHHGNDRGEKVARERLAKFLLQKRKGRKKGKTGK